MGRTIAIANQKGGVGKTDNGDQPVGMPGRGGSEGSDDRF